MKKLLMTQTAFLLSFFLISSLSAQTIDYQAKAYQYIKDTYGLDQKSIGDLKIKDRFTSPKNGVEHVHFVQTYKGFEIFGTEINLAFQKDGKISSVNHRLTLVDGINFSSTKTKIEAPQAIGIIAGSLGIASRAVPQLIKHTSAGIPVYDKSDIALQDIPTEIGYLHTTSGEYHLCWKIQIESSKNGRLYQSIVDATNGEVIANDEMTSHCSFEEGYLMPESNCMDAPSPVTVTSSPPPTGVFGQYRVLPPDVESPNHGDFVLETGLDDVNASPFGWHDTNGVAGAEFTTTQGNNVHAFLDRDWNYSPDAELDGGINLTFDFPFDTAGEPVVNKNIAVTSLFFRNNFMHDFAYNYGFNEVAGNFQSRNYTGGGGDQDFVNAHAQFGDNNPTQCGIDVNGSVDCLNNADFSTPVDGFNGRMRMFTWNLDNSSKFLDVLQPLELSGKIQTGLAQFGPDITSTPTTGLAVIMNDESISPTFGCVPLSNPTALEGKIVIIDRGLCDFSEKVLNAQEAGAIGAVICNFEDVVIGMGAGAGAASVTIPSVFISKGDCARIRVAAADGLELSLVAPVAAGGPLLRDGTLDNSIISHEFGHGISTRLTGGPGNSSCLSPNALTGDAEEAYGMGEGWSDFFALVTTARPGDTGAKRRGIGTYANKEAIEGRGIRSYPYSTDMSIDPHTYDDILFEVVPHGVGSVWTAMLWDLYWAFSDEYGWDPDLYYGTGGNNMAIQLVMDGLKLQPCNPGFIDARDAILQADQINNGGANQCLIWNVFARRGLGWDADGGDPNSRSDGIEGFSPLPTCVKELKLTKTMTPEIVAGDEIVVTLHVTNHKDEILTNVELEDPIPNGTTYVAGSANIEPLVGNTLVWSFDSMDPNEEMTITYSLKSDPAKNSIRTFYDDIEGDALDRWDIYYDPDGTSSNLWSQEDIIVHSGVSGWVVADVATESKHYLQNFEPYTITGNYPVYRFYHYYNTEAGADGGFLEISTDGGDTWVPLGDHVFRNGYPRRLQYGTFAIPDLYAFSGLSNPELKMTPVYIDLSDYQGETNVKIRYRFGTDDNTSADGWYIDDVELMDAVLYNSQACVSADQSSPVCAEAPQRGTIVDTQIMSATDDGQDNSALGVMPNPAGDLIQVVLDATSQGDATIRVYDLTGQLMTTKKWNLHQGINQDVVNISSYTPGMYVIRVESGDQLLSKKFVKE
jgi:uncharacterized repeat protein (TIGR01451 family)